MSIRGKALRQHESGLSVHGLMEEMSSGKQERSGEMIPFVNDAGERSDHDKKDTEKAGDQEEVLFRHPVQEKGHEKGAEDEQNNGYRCRRACEDLPLQREDEDPEKRKRSQKPFPVQHPLFHPHLSMCPRIDHIRFIIHDSPFPAQPRPARESPISLQSSAGRL